MPDAPCFTVTRYRLTVDNGYGVDIVEYTTRDAAEDNASRAMLTQDEGKGVWFEIDEIQAFTCPCCN